MAAAQPRNLAPGASPCPYVLQGGGRAASRGVFFSSSEAPRTFATPTGLAMLPGEMAAPIRLGLLTPSSNTCLEPIAAAFARARGSQGWWRAHLGDAFRAIVERERITRRNAMIKKIDKRWPDALRALWPRQTP